MPAALTLMLSCAATTLLLLATSMTPGGAPVGSWLRAGADTANRIMAPDTAPRPMQLRAADRGEDDAATAVIGRLVVGVGGTPFDRQTTGRGDAGPAAGAERFGITVSVTDGRGGPAVGPGARARTVAAMVEGDDPAYAIEDTLAFAAMLQASIVEHRHLANRSWLRHWFSGAASQGGETARAVRVTSLGEIVTRPTRLPASPAALVLCWSAGLLLVAYLALRRRA